MEDNKNHILTVEGQRKICLSHVLEVDKVTDESIKITLVGGKKVIINGANLKLGAFSKQNATFFAEGIIYEIKYGGEGGFLKKLLK